jgi:hypothetical protein
MFTLGVKLTQFGVKSCAGQQVRVAGHQHHNLLGPMNGLARLPSGFKLKSGPLMLHSEPSCDGLPSQ